MAPVWSFRNIWVRRVCCIDSEKTLRRPNLATVAALALFWFKVGVIPTLLGCSIAGVLLLVAFGCNRRSVRALPIRRRRVLR